MSALPHAPIHVNTPKLEAHMELIVLHVLPQDITLWLPQPQQVLLVLLAQLDVVDAQAIQLLAAPDALLVIIMQTEHVHHVALDVQCVLQTQPARPAVMDISSAIIYVTLVNLDVQLVLELEIHAQRALLIMSYRMVDVFH